MGFFSDLGNAVASGVSAVGDAVEGAVDAVTDTVEDAVDAVVDTVQDGIEGVTESACKNGGPFVCGAANVIGGALDGLLEGTQSILDDAFDIVRGVGGIVGSALRLDLPGLLKGLGALAIDIGSLGIKVLRFGTGGYVVGGIIKHFNRSALIAFVDELVESRFEDVDRRQTVRDNIGLDDGRFGFRLPSEHRIFVLDSNNVPLFQMHNDGVIDLFAMAGLLSFDSFALGLAHPRTVVATVDDEGNDNFFPVNRFVIAKHIESQGEANRLRVYAMSRQAAAEILSTTSRKLEEIGVILEWNDGENFSWFRQYTRQDVTEAEYDFDSNGIEALLARPDFNRPPGINCSLVALGAFKLDIFGRVAGRTIRECDDFSADNCDTPGRTDQCCNTINRRQSSGVIYRDIYPSDFFQYVLAHEIGHYLGLCHCGHDGFHNVMFTGRSNSFLSLGLLNYYWNAEPHFSLEDGKNAWRFIVDQMTSCLTGEPEGEVVIVEAARAFIASSPGSCGPTEDVMKEPEKVPEIA